MKYKLAVFDMDGTILKYIGRSGRQYQLCAEKTWSAGENIGRGQNFCRKWYWQTH